MAGVDLASAARPAIVEADDIQAFVRSGFGRLTEACFVLLRIADAAAARKWLAAAPVTAVSHLGHELDQALQLAFTAEGLQALDLAPEILAKFSAEFISGMAGEDARSRRLGDVGSDAPTHWQWGYGGQNPHVLVMFYAKPGGLESFRKSIEDAHWQTGFNLIATLDTSTPGREPFGFADGLSQPEVDWSHQRTPGTDADESYGNLVALGEFLLGYRNEYGLYTDRPLLDPADDPLNTLAAAEEDAAKRDLARNGSYLAFRQLRQDVRGFWKFMGMQSAGDPVQRLQLAESMVGRRIDGAPLMPAERDPIPGIDQTPDEIGSNQFTYTADPDGMRCPFGAHIRRTNPRNGDLPGGKQGAISSLIRTLGFGGSDPREDVVATTRFHRMLRRGRPYGAQLTPDQSVSADCPDPQAGLNFICLNANLSRQFEFVQDAWLRSSKFGGLSGESDPLLGNRLPLETGTGTDQFTLPQPTGLCRRISGMPKFVSVAGGAYFFLPSLRALRYLTGNPRR